MKKIVIFVAGFFLVVLPLTAQAISFDFYGEDRGGAGSATLTFDGLNTTHWEILIDNTSPLTLLDGTGVNTPGITGIGFDVQDSSISAFQWSLTISDNIKIGGTSGSTEDWILGAATKDIVIDFNSTTDNGSKGALYNPSATEGFGGPPIYFTTATLILDFEMPEDLEVWLDSAKEGSPFVRMQNVGNGGSLKLVPVPEPATILLAGLGLLGLGIFARRKGQKRL